MTAGDESLPSLLRRTQQEAGLAGHPVRLIDEPPFTVLVAGPVDAGKTTLVRTLLDDGRPLGEPALGARPGFSTTVPVEYVYGPLALWLGLGGTHLVPERWVPARPGDPDLMFTPGLRRVRVITPASVLRDWDVRLVDHPGTDAPDDSLGPLVEAARNPHTGVLYVVPSRGVTDDDGYALEALRIAPVVVVGSLRAAELTADQSALYEIEVPWMTAGVALPILVPRLAEPGAERAALRDGVELLRGVNRPVEWRSGVVDACVRCRRRMREEYTAAFDRAIRVRRSDPLRTLGELVRLAARGRVEGELEDALIRSARRAGTEPDVTGLREAVETKARKAVDDYNLEAVRSAPASSATAAATSGTQLGHTYQQVRTDLIAALGRIAADRVLGLTKGDQEMLAKIVEAITADRLEIAVLGQFSAGKSTLINALLNERVLPARRGPTTAAVTLLVYGKKPAVTATWRDQVELTLLSQTREPNKIRVHVQELVALDEWLRTGEVSAQDCAFQLFGPGTADNAAQLDALGRLWHALTRAAKRGGLPEYAYLDHQDPQVPRGAVPGRVVVRRFARPTRDWPGNQSIADALGQAGDKNSPLTLRLDKVYVAYPHPLLEHVTIIDTPGTDAPVPHHQAMAYSAVMDKPQCAVIYCFAGFKAAGNVDRKNLVFLQKANVGAHELSRFFFTITQKGLVNPPEHQPQVRGNVVAALKDLGIPVDKTYFVEVVHERNQDFQDLLADLNQFVTQNKGALVASWIEQARKVVTGVQERHQSRLDLLASGEQARLERLGLLQAEEEEIDKLAEDMRTSSAWGEPYLRKRISLKRAAAASDIDTEIGALTTREGFDEIARTLERSLKELNEWAQKAVSGGATGAVSGLRAELGTRLPGRTVSDPVIPPGDVFFPATAILDAVEAAHWRGNWQRIKDFFRSEGPDWSADLVTNRERIETAWRTVRQAGKLRLCAARETIDSQLTAEIDRLADGIALEIRDAEQVPSPRDRQAAADGLERSNDWARRLGALAKSATGGKP